jgi:hypothetical protein
MSRSKRREIGQIQRRLKKAGLPANRAQIARALQVQSGVKSFNDRVDQMNDWHEKNQTGLPRLGHFEDAPVYELFKEEIKKAESYTGLRPLVGQEKAAVEDIYRQEMAQRVNLQPLGFRPPPLEEVSGQAKAKVTLLHLLDDVKNQTESPEVKEFLNAVTMEVGDEGRKIEFKGTMTPWVARKDLPDTLQGQYFDEYIEVTPELWKKWSDYFKDHPRKVDPRISHATLPPTDWSRYYPPPPGQAGVEFDPAQPWGYNPDGSPYYRKAEKLPDGETISGYSSQPAPLFESGLSEQERDLRIARFNAIVNQELESEGVDEDEDEAAPLSDPEETAEGGAAGGGKEYEALAEVLHTLGVTQVMGNTYVTNNNPGVQMIQAAPAPAEEPEPGEGENVDSDEAE